MKYAQSYTLTPRRRAALRRASAIAAAKRRYGYGRHDLGKFAAKAVRKAAHVSTLSGTTKVVNFQEFLAKQGNKKAKKR